MTKTLSDIRPGDTVILRHYVTITFDQIAAVTRVTKEGWTEVTLVRDLARLGNYPANPDSSLQLIPVSERMPGPEDCNSEEKAMRPQQQQQQENN